MKRVSPEEALELVEGQGYVLVDVRSVMEFEQGHPTGAFNVPIMHRSQRGMTPNPDFMSVMEATFEKGTKLVVACLAGGRSKQAATLLIGSGFSDVVDQRAGFGGTKDPFGKVQERGWRDAGLPISGEPQEGRTYEELVNAIHGAPDESGEPEGE